MPLNKEMLRLFDDDVALGLKTLVTAVLSSDRALLKVIEFCIHF